MPAPEMIDPDTLHRLIRTGLTAALKLEAGYTAEDAALAQATIAADISRQAATYGLTAPRNQVAYLAETEPAGLFGPTDPYRRITLTGIWRFTPGSTVPAVLHNGPQHGRQYAIAPEQIFDSLVFYAAPYPPRHYLEPDTALDAAVEVRTVYYQLAGYQPVTRAFIYRHQETR